MAPTLYRPLTGQLQLRLPYQPGNRVWLRDHLGERIHLTWVKAGYWAIAREHLMPLLEALVAEYGKVAVWLEFKLTQLANVAPLKPTQLANLAWAKMILSPANVAAEKSPPSKVAPVKSRSQRHQLSGSARRRSRGS